MKAQKIKTIKQLINPKPKQRFELPDIYLAPDCKLYVGTKDEIAAIKKRYEQNESTKD